jgi:hypothetical protein
MSDATDDEFSIPEARDIDLMAASAYLIEAWEKNDNPEYFARAFQHWRQITRRWILMKRKASELPK